MCMDLEQFDTTTLSYLDSAVVFGGPVRRSRSYLFMGIAYAISMNAQAARSSFNSVLKEHPNSIRAEELKSQLLEYDQIPNRDPTIASLLAIIPGQGYMYTSHVQTSLASVLVLGLLFWGTQSAIEDENYGLAGLSGVLSLGWYVGSIRGSWQSAHRFNQYHKDTYISRFK